MIASFVFLRFLKEEDERTNQSEGEATMLLVARFKPACF